MKLLKLSPSTRKGKKYMAILKEDSGKIHKIHFGALGYQDYTDHKDETRKSSYISRHRTTENWNNPLTPGFWSRWLLWNKPTIFASLMDIKDRYNLY